MHTRYAKTDEKCWDYKEQSWRILCPQGRLEDLDRMPTELMHRTKTEGENQCVKDRLARDLFDFQKANGDIWDLELPDHMQELLEKHVWKNW